MFKSIRTRTTITFIALATIPLLLVALILGLHDYQQEQQNIIASQHQLADRVTEQVNNFIAGLENELRVVTEVHGLAVLPPSEQNQVLGQLLTYEGDFDQLRLLDSQGIQQIYLTSISLTGGAPATNQVTLPEFSQPLSTGKTYYSPITFDDLTGQPHIIIAVPMFNSGTFSGVLVADARVKKIWDLMSSVNLGPDENIYIVDASHRVVSDINPSIVLKGTYFDPPRAAQSGGIQRGLHYSSALLYAEDMYLGNQAFTVVVEQSADQALGPTKDAALIVVLVTVLAFLIASLIGVLAVRSILEPIHALSRATQVISKGDLSQPVHVKSQDEIGELARVFDGMRLQLRQTLEGLEQRVTDRTRDLHIAADVSRQITTVLNIHELLEQVVTLAAQEFNFYSVSVFLLDNQTNQLTHAATASAENGVSKDAFPQAIPLDTEPSIVAQAARTKQAVRVEDVQQSPAYMPNPALPKTRSELAIPMMLGTRLMGVFDLESETPGRFEKEELNVLTALAAQIAVAVRNAQLFAEAENARHEAEQSNKVKSQFLASMSHELRTPLNAILNFSQFIARGIMGPVTPDQVEALNSVVDSGKHLLNLINDVLDISKIESGAMRLFVDSNLEPGKVVTWVQQMAQPLVENKPVKVETDVSNDLPAIVGDERRVRQIMLNLVSNACKFTENGSVTIGAHRNNGDILFYVRDTGPGIAPEDHEAIFEIFRQTESGLRHGGGTGLGLPISRRLAEAHGGQLWLESTPGHGATFFVSLPIRSESLLAMARDVKAEHE